MKLGWIGVGKMGLPMASHLLAAGHAVAACDLVPALVAAAVARGAQAAPTPAAAAREAEVVFSSIPDDSALRAVTLTENGVFASARPGAVYVDTSTVSAAASAEVAAAATARGVHYLRVTVSGNNKMAESKALTIIASGEQAVYERCQPLLALFGPQQYYVGDAEQARTLKLAINLMVYATVGGLAEALVMGSRGGLDWAQMLDVMAASAVGSPLLKNKSADLKKRNFSPTFSCLQARKDLALINGAAAASGIRSPLAQSLAAMIEDCIANGSADEDYAAMIKAVERTAR
ncbi:MAG TPA: NAD(P)-dependent oxidoreductase [Burkholderiales bacterium]|nr:NAD(P)-dependent oxidoreductase [Burkholderiales bacterium]